MRASAGGDSRLSPVGRHGRAATVVVVLALLAAGTFWGLADHFPFTPFTQFAGSVGGTAEFASPRIEAITAAGDEVVIGFRAFGLRRAEFEGQMRRPRFRDDPAELLELLSVAYERLGPDRPELVEIRLVYRVHRLAQGRSAGHRDVTSAVWSRS
ncbi:MAG: hypothetical protein ACRDJJ_05165 [Actinomycetota bacterium]